MFIKLRWMLITLSVFTLTFGRSLDGNYENLTLDDCIKIALENNKRISISNYDIDIASAQLRQARSGNWPSLNLTSSATILDEDPVNINPAFRMELKDIELAGLSIPSLPVNVPEEVITLMDNKNIMTEVDLMFPIFTGGKISSLINQAKNNLEMLNNKKVKSELEVIYDTKKMYYTYQLTRNLFEIGEEALERLKVTLELTENLYKNGTGRVTKIDFLQNSVVVESVKGIVSRLEENHLISKEALKFIIGLNWNDSISISNEEIPSMSISQTVNDLVLTARDNNPVIKQINQALKIFESKIDEAQSDYYPNIALIGKYTNIVNSYDYGIVSDAMKNRFMIGLGLNMSLFNGFRTANKVDEAEAGLKQLNSKKILLENGISLNIHQLYYKNKGAEERHGWATNAMELAIENRDLAERAYKNDLVEIEEFITAQVMESIMKAQYQLALFEKANLDAQLEKTLGKNLVN